MQLIPDLLVIEANILFSFFRSDSMRRHLIEELLNRGCKLVSPDSVLMELLGDKEKIIKFSGINESEFMFLSSLLNREIKISSKEEYEESLSGALELFPQHSKDAPYFALALSKDIPLWSDEKRHKAQSKVKVLSTGDIKRLLGIV